MTREEILIEKLMILFNEGIRDRHVISPEADAKIYDILFEYKRGKNEQQTKG